MRLIYLPIQKATNAEYQTLTFQDAIGYKNDVIMVIVNSNKLQIEIQHPCPDDFLHDLISAIISALQRQEVNEVTTIKEFQQENFTLLEILKHLAGNKSNNLPSK